MRYLPLFLVLISTFSAHAQTGTNSEFFDGQIFLCSEAGLPTAMAFLGFGSTCGEQSINQIRVVAPDLDEIVNSDQNPALLRQSRAYQSVRVVQTPWQTQRGAAVVTPAIRASVQQQFRAGSSWSLRYEGHLVSPMPVFFVRPTNESQHFGQQLFRLAYANCLSVHWSWGLAAKYAYQAPKSYAGFARGIKVGAWAADLGLRYQNEKALSAYQHLYWQWGLSLSNLGPRIRAYNNETFKRPLPSAISMGFLLEERMQLSTQRMLRISGAYQLNKLLVPTPCTNCDNDQDGTLDFWQYGTLEGMWASFSDAPGGFSEEYKEINHQLEMAVRYFFHRRFSAKAKTTLFHQHRDKGNVQYLMAHLGLQFGGLQLGATYWHPSSRAFGAANNNQLGLSLGYQRVL